MLLLNVFLSLSWINSFGQEKTIKYKTKFVPEHITYNGSSNPNECWESVDSGVRIKTKEGNLFFVMPVQEVERLKDKLQDSEVWIEVEYYPVLERPSNGSGARGRVISVAIGNEVAYPNR